jgi:O-antigen/teichoic acid export membrane protein
MQRFSTHVAWTFGTRILMLMSGVGASVIVARWLGAEGLGALAVLNVTVAVALQLGSAGLPSANTYFIARDKNSVAPVCANALTFALIAGTALALIIIASSRFYPSLFGNIPVGLVTIAAASIPFQLITLLGLNVFLGLHRIGRFNTLDAGAQSLLLVNAVLALVVFGAGLRLLVSLNTTASVLVSLLIVLMIARLLREVSDRGFRVDLGLFKRMARYGIKFHIAAVAGLLIIRADLLLVNHFRKASEAGVYAVATQVATMLLVLPGVIGTLIFPRIASSATDEQGEYAVRATRHTAFIMLIVCMLAVPATFLLPVIYGPSFADVPVQMLLLLPGVYLLGLEAVLVQHFNSTGLPVAIPIFWLLTLTVNVTLNLIFVPTFGARAAALISSISYAMIFALVAFYFRLTTGQRFSAMMFLRGAEFRRILSLNHWRSSA